MVVKKKKGKDRLDKFYHLAKEHGYRSRAAFKLVQLNKKFNFLANANVVIDLCAAPGSWCQVAAKFMPAGKTIIGVDLDAIKPIPNVTTFVNDITTQSCRLEIKKLIKNQKAEVVLHDGAPNVGTAWTHDAYMQAELTLSACRLATEFLSPNGTFVTKVFRSAEYTKLLWVFNQLFTRVTATKPQASRNVSAEIFVVCEGYLAPKKIDPKLLDPKHVLTSVEQKGYAYSIFAKKASRHRTGYGQDAGAVLSKRTSVKQFIKADDPIAVLSSCNTLHFDDDDCKKYRESPRLTEELKICFADLKVLGKRDFKALLKFRSQMRAQDAEDRAAAESSEEEDDTPLTKEEEDAQLLKEMDDHMRQIAKQEKKKKKKTKELREKNKRRMALTLDVGDEFDDPGAVDSLFNLKRVNKKLATDVAPDAVAVRSEDEESSEEEEVDPNEYVSDDERLRRYEAQLEERMDDMYTKYLVRTRKIKSKRALDNLQREGLDDDEQDGEGGVLDLGSDEEFEEDAASKLIVKDAQDASATAKMWFDEPLFSGILENTGDETAEMQRRLKAIMEAQKSKKKEESDSDDADDESGSSDEGSDGEDSFEVVPTAPENGDDSDIEVPAAKRKVDKSKKNGDQIHVVDVKKMNAEKEAERKKAEEAKKKKEELAKQKAAKKATSSSAPAAKQPVAKDRKALEKEKAKKRGANAMDVDDGSSEDSAESSFEEMENNAVVKANESDTDYDTDEKAQIMAMAAKLRDPTARSAMTDHAYSRHMFTTAEELPRWFMDDEKTNNRPLVPISKEEYTQFREQLKAIDSRATHRVAEAQARKKKRMERAMEKAKARAGKILESEEIPDAAKKRELERIFAKAKSKFKPAKAYVVSGGQRLDHGKRAKGQVTYTRHVDTRLKKDKRAAKAQDRKRKRK